MELGVVSPVQPELMTHQAEGVAFLLGRKSGLLAFEQGLGKTAIAIAAFLRLRDSKAASVMVVICPNSLKRTWENEVARFGPGLRVAVVSGPPRERRQTLSSEAADIFVVNYECARNEIIAIQAIMRRAPAVLVLDESHYVKNVRSLNSIAATHLSPLTEYRWLLTGTPVTNRPTDIYPQLRMVAGEGFTSHASFVARYGEADTIAGQRDGLANLIAQSTMRRTKEQCIDLPEKSFVDVWVELPAWQRRLYDDVRDGIVREVEGMSAEAFKAYLPKALTRLLRLSQVASNPRLVFSGETRTPGKATELDRIVDEIVVTNNRKLIIWSYYVRTIEDLADRYKHLGAVSLYGATPAGERQDVATRFQADASVRVLVANPAAAGTGLTLTAASYAVYETLTWRYDLYAQSQDRNHRIGQGQPVTYIRLLASDTIEQAITEALARKAVMASDLLGDVEGVPEAAAMTPASFCELLRTGHLSEVAVP